MVKDTVGEDLMLKEMVILVVYWLKYNKAVQLNAIVLLFNQ